MPWERRRYRGNKAWVETDAQGALVLDERGLARLRYKPADERTYSVRPGEVKALDGAVRAAEGPQGPQRPREPQGPQDPQAPGPRPSRPPRSRRARPPGSAREVEAAAAPAPTEGDDGEPGDDIPALAGLAVHAYTDGASSGNPGPSGAGAVLLFREHRKELSLYLGDTTNNVAELEAVLLALRAIRDRHIPVRVHADSSYVIGVLDGSMRVKANAPLVARIREEMKGFRDLRFVKVAGHAGVEHNERADALARAEIRRHRKRADPNGSS